MSRCPPLIRITAVTLSVTAHGVMMLAMKDLGCSPVHRPASGTSMDEMTAACIEWLEAHEVFQKGGDEHVAAYRGADQRLLAAFAADWNPPNPRIFAQAFQTFRDCLLAQHEAMMAPSVKWDKSYRR